MLLLIPLALLWIAFALYGLYSFRTIFWRATQGELTKLKVVPNGDGDGGYKLYVAYTYKDPQVQTYISHTLWASFTINLSSQASWRRTHLRLFKNRRQLTVYHHPKHPEHAVLFRGMHPLTSLGYTLFNALFIGGYLLYLANSH